MRLDVTLNCKSRTQTPKNEEVSKQVQGDRIGNTIKSTPQCQQKQRFCVMNDIRSFVCVRKGIPLLLGYILFFSSAGFSQQLSNLRKKAFALNKTKDTLKLDTLSIVPGTLTLTYGNAHLLDTSYYKLDEVSGKIFLLQDRLKGQNISTDSVYVNYRVFPYDFSQTLQHKNKNTVHPTLYAQQDAYYYQVNPNNPNDPLDMGTLSKSGSISRGITFGNSQNLSVNSNLNLQLAGKLSNNVNVLVAATDNNLPIQPEGNTQQLQDFDKVFVKLYNRDASLIAGDYELNSPQDYFMKFYKKAQGGMINTRFITQQNKDTTKEGMLKFTLAGAISKGKFAENKITPIDGNLGPYRLTGTDNETYIVVLSGTESVYLDGQLMQRGQNNDYTIDYNSALVTFTPKHLITQNTRIVIDFQYSDLNYLRSLIHAGTEYHDAKTNLHFNIYSEQDAKNQPLQQNLSDQQKQLMAAIGDTISKAIVPGIDSIAFNSTQVLYRKVDTTVNTFSYIAYVYCTDSTKAHFALSFTQVAQGQGDYVQIPSAANGSVFKWMAPVGGIHQGNFQPIVQLITPKKKQMATLGGDYKVGAHTIISAEGAITNNDVNTFSAYDKSQDVGYAGSANIHNVAYFADSAANKGKVWKLISNLGYEGVQHDFNPIERYRPVEFSRDWNRTNDTIYGNQNLLNANLALCNKKDLFQYGFQSLTEQNLYTGIKQNISLKFNEAGFNTVANGSLLDTKSTTEISQYYKEGATVSHKLFFWVVGAGEATENDVFRSRQTDSIVSTNSTLFDQANSFKYVQWNAFIRSGDTNKNSYGFNYQERTDYGARSNTFLKSMFSRNLSFDINLAKNPKNRFKANVTYHILSVFDTVLAVGQQPVNALVGQAQYDLNALHGVIFSSTFYQAGSGLQPKEEYTYVQVAEGQGVYAWTDFNNDGIKQLNEFYVAPFPDEADYIKVYTPTNQYIKTYTSGFTETFSLKPAAVWATKKGLRGFIGRFSEQVAIHVDRKTTDNNPALAYNPFLQNIADTNVVGLNSSIRNTVFFNQLNPTFGADYTYSDNINKTILEETGAQSRETSYNQLHGRLNFTTKWTIEAEGKLGEDISSAQFFSANNFNVALKEVQPKLTYQPSTSFRTSLLFIYTNKINASSQGGGVSTQQNYGTEVKYNVLKKGSLIATFNFVKIDFNGEASSPLGFEMLQGLNIGNNYTWSLSYQVNLSANIQLSLAYNGRDSQGAKIINTGSAQVRAFF